MFQFTRHPSGALLFHDIFVCYKHVTPSGLCYFMTYSCGLNILPLSVLLFHNIFVCYKHVTPSGLCYFMTYSCATNMSPLRGFVIS
jgi:hypothetical protein